MLSPGEEEFPPGQGEGEADPFPMPASGAGRRWAQEEGGEEGGESRQEAYLVQGGYSPAAALRRGVWLGGRDEEASLRRAAERLARRLALRRSRRYAPARRGPKLDLRRTLRASLRAGGEAVRLYRRHRRPRLWRLVALCDVSGSMDTCARLLLRFAHALHHVAPQRVEVFAFSTALSRITPYLRRRSPGEALEQAVAALPDWGGGTRIGECFEAWCRRYGGRLLGRGTVLVVLSDGLDMGQVQPLQRALERMRRGCRRLIWLNPLASDPSYRPLARGMRAALPYLDALLPAGDAASLERLERYLR